MEPIVDPKKSKVKKFKIRLKFKSKLIFRVRKYLYKKNFCYICISRNNHDGFSHECGHKTHFSCLEAYSKSSGKSDCVVCKKDEIETIPFPAEDNYICQWCTNSIIELRWRRCIFCYCRLHIRCMNEMLKEPEIICCFCHSDEFPVQVNNINTRIESRPRQNLVVEISSLHSEDPDY